MEKKKRKQNRRMSSPSTSMIRGRYILAFILSMLIYWIGKQIRWDPSALRIGICTLMFVGIIHFISDNHSDMVFFEPRLLN